MFSTELAYTLEAAYREAANRKHGYFCIEHILFALLFDDQVRRTIRHCGGDVDTLKHRLEQFFDTEIETQGDPDEEDSSTEAQPIQTEAVHRVLQRAIMQTHASGRNVITPQEVFIAIYSEPDSHASYFLLDQGVTKVDALSYLSHGISKAGIEDEFADESPQPHDTEEGGTSPKPRNVLAKYTENLSQLAREGKLDPVVGREREIERALKILSRRLKNNPLLLGDPGVGKSALAMGLAQRIADKEVPESLAQAEVFSLSMGNVIAGTKFRGEFEERLRVIVEELMRLPQPILFIDEIHTLVGAGATGSGSMDAANLLKPALTSGKLRCIGATTYEEYKKSFEKDRALSRRFSQIDISEPSVEETVEILGGLKDRFEKHHSVTYSAASLRAAAELSAKHITDRFLPDKAIDVIDEAGAENRMRGAKKKRSTISEKDIERVVSAIAKVPVKNVSRTDQEALRMLEEHLTQQVYGQDPAVQAVSRAIKRSRASLKRPDKPVGCFLFAGPTGVGKTELAKVLARELGVQFHRFDMSEFMEKHAVARLIGAPPGYVGYEEGGQLTDLVRKNPYAVLLFDEIEKAHEDLFNILLQVMDDARLTDSQGKKADFRNIILILTTNAGSEKASALGFGLQSGQGNRDVAIKKLFKPEFRNRLDEIIHFNPLPMEVIERIVTKFVSELESQLSERKISFDITPEAREMLAQKGFDPILGARPMARLIEKEIKDPLADEILFGKLQRGGKVKIAVRAKKLVFDF